MADARTSEQRCKHGVRLPHECAVCRDVVNPPGCICRYAHKSDPMCQWQAPVTSKQSAIPYTLTLHGRAFNVGEILLLLDLNAKFTDGPGEAAALIRALLQPSETATPRTAEVERIALIAKNVETALAGIRKAATYSGPDKHLKLTLEFDSEFDLAEQWMVALADCKFLLQQLGHDVQ